MRWLQARLSTQGPGGWTMTFDCGPTASDTVAPDGLQPGTAKAGMEVCGMFDHSQLATLPHPVYRSTKKIVFESPSPMYEKLFWASQPPERFVRLFVAGSPKTWKLKE